MLSLSAAARPLTQAATGVAPLLVLSGPEGGLTAQEEQAALAQGFQPVSLGARVLRAETAPLAVLSALPGKMNRNLWGLRTFRPATA